MCRLWLLLLMTRPASCYLVSDPACFLILLYTDHLLLTLACVLNLSLAYCFGTSAVCLILTLVWLAWYWPWSGFWSCFCLSIWYFCYLVVDDSGLSSTMALLPAPASIICVLHLCATILPKLQSEQPRHLSSIQTVVCPPTVPGPTAGTRVTSHHANPCHQLQSYWTGGIRGTYSSVQPLPGMWHPGNMVFNVRIMHCYIIA